ncbi:uncharacterized protein METZ01_LOCUS222520, partial [marine metagenome]
LDNPEPLTRISIEKPTMKMTFGVNTSPFSGNEGQNATSRMLWDRLSKELKTNVSLQIEKTDKPDEFLVSGRGELHLSVLIENMRREGLEFQVSKPSVITHYVGKTLHEPYELLTIDSVKDFIGPLTEELAKRLAYLVDIKTDSKGNAQHLFKIPTRGLIGFRSFFLRITRGNGIMNSQSIESQPVEGEIKSTRSGAIISTETGMSTAYSIKTIQDRGELFIHPQTYVYEGMIIGKQNRPDDLSVNVCREKKLTNHRASSSEISEHINTPLQLSLDESLAFITDDELVEITPTSIRIRKKVLQSSIRQKGTRDKSKAK